MMQDDMRIPSVSTLHRSGFTIMELLVSIAVIAIIASLLLPALSRSKESARTVICMNSNKQIGLATALYAEENRGHIPSFCNWLFESKSKVAAIDECGIETGRIYPFLATRDIYMCPTDGATLKKPQKLVPRFDRAAGYGGTGWRQTSYSMDCRTCHYNNLARWKTPSKTAMYVEGLSSTNDCSGIAPPFTTSESQPYLAFRHRKKAFVTMGDFSVQQKSARKYVGGGAAIAELNDLLTVGPYQEGLAKVPLE
jgi:prepilin-type N-terminal cleavage/methylation domain-containing protein